MRKSNFLLIIGMLATLISCSNVPTTTNTDTSTTSEETTSKVEPTTGNETTTPATDTSTDIFENLPDFFKSTSVGYSKDFLKLESYTPTTFQKDTFEVLEDKQLSDGVNLTKYNYLLNSSKKVIAHTLTIDLKKADIVTGYSNTKDTVYGISNSYELSTNKKVVAGINADYFGGAVPVNAFVSACNIIKSSHNDNGIYDPSNANADIPYSKPMLFGVSGEIGRIAPIVEDKTLEETIKGKFKYQFTIAGENKETKTIDAVINLNYPRLRNGINVLEDGTKIKVFSGSKMYKFERTQSPLLKIGKMVSVEDISSDMDFQNDNVKDYFYIIETATTQFSCEINDFVTMNVASEDSKWNYYTEIIGGRHSLIENGNIAPTLASEYQNGAANTGVPRSAVGLKDKNTVCIVAIEGLRYNSNIKVEDSDGYGVNLTQLADFMRYLSIYDAVNLDGGGSTQLVVRNSETSNKELLVRSSDYGVYDLNKCRSVYNSILVTEKEMCKY